jgi:hypothetical protein
MLFYSTDTFEEDGNDSSKRLLNLFAKVPVIDFPRQTPNRRGDIWLGKFISGEGTFPPPFNIIYHELRSKKRRKGFLYFF